MDEQSLIAAAQQGDLTAFNSLVEQYQQGVFNTAYRVLLDADAAADATQDAFLSAYRAIGKFRGGSFRAWLLRIVTNACYDQLRAKKRRPTASLDALLLSPDDPGPFVTERTQDNPLDQAMRVELRDVIHAGLRTLPPDQRLAVVLSDIQGFKYQEIAAIMDVSTGTVKSRLSRGRAKLRDYLLDQKELLPDKYRLKRKV
ncbi:MAG: sigma-70 family RNA polymerase sigma factor [Chloroflexi bacterium]|nr:sigma-70 family RNA polymerase sigma factor [Chloroflexota bacterium]